MEHTDEAIAKLGIILEFNEYFAWRNITAFISDVEEPHLVKHLGLTHSCKASPKVVMHVCDSTRHNMMNCPIYKFRGLIATQ